MTLTLTREEKQIVEWALIREMKFFADNADRLKHKPRDYEENLRRQDIAYSIYQKISDRRTST